MNFESEKFYIVGNNLALDFINSVMFELTLSNLLGWTIAADLVNEETARGLLQKWNEKEVKIVSDFRQNLRETVENLAKGKKLKKIEIDSINEALRQTGGFSELTQTSQGFAKRFVIDLSEPEKLLVSIAESFADLLCFGDLNFLRKCEGESCILYFYDTTKNHKRRWCSMAICGNRAKAAKFYQKKKARV